MRELKYRAWDTEAKCYVKDPILTDNFGQVYEVCEEASNKRGTCLITHKPNVILEQYTGLKDKNGKEIYEGDILEFDKDFDDNTNKYVPFFDEKLAAISFRMYGYQDYISESGSEEFESNMSFIGDMENYEREEILFYTEYISIIGDIHNNPELLEDAE